jgi:hypothetical protein
LEDLGFSRNFLLRAHGLSIEPSRKTPNLTKTKKSISNDFYSVKLNNIICSDSKDRNEFFLNMYNLYIDGNLVQENYTETDYTITYLPVGNHTFGVKALYVNGIESEIAQINFTGGTSNDDNTLAKPFLNSYPNPFNPTTNISFNLKKDSKVNLSIFNVKGQKVNDLINENKKAGNHSLIWNGTNQYGKTLPTGVYFVRLKTEFDERTTKILMIK